MKSSWTLQAARSVQEDLEKVGHCKLQYQHSHAHSPYSSVTLERSACGSPFPLATSYPPMLSLPLSAHACSFIPHLSSNKIPLPMKTDLASAEIPLLRPLRKISDTTFGEVWACKVIDCDGESVGKKSQIVAVKLVSLEHLATAKLSLGNRAIDDPMVEIEVGRILMEKGKHPHITQQVDQLTSGNMVCLISEFCTRGDLYTYLESRLPSRRLVESEAVRVMRHILLGVQFLHETLGLAHRDLSLENVLLGDDGSFKLTDFALAVDVSKPCSDRAGKDMYMAPEVVSLQHSYDPARADVWSLGIIWFILLTGSAPFAIASLEQSGFEVISQHGIRLVLKKWGFDRRISASTVDLLDAMLQVNPQQRATLRFVLDHPMIASAE